MKRKVIYVILLSSILLLGGCSNKNDSKSVTTESNEMSEIYTDEKLECLSHSSTEYNYDLASKCIKMCMAMEDAYDSNDDTKIKNTYAELFNSANFFSSNPENPKDSYYYTFSSIENAKINGEAYNILLINARGSKTWEEFGKDVLSQPTKRFEDNYLAYTDCYGFYYDIAVGLDDYIRDNPFLQEGKLKVVISGHSLGGAAANLVAAKFNIAINKHDGLAVSLTSKQDVYCYTFGAINSISSPQEVGFENIHNVYNYYDSFGPNHINIFRVAVPRFNKMNNKFGHIELFGHNQKWYDDYNDDDLNIFDKSTYWQARQHSTATYKEGIDEPTISGLKTCVDGGQSNIEDEELPQKSEEERNENSEDISLVGIWRAKDGSGIEFNEDGTFAFDWGMGYYENGTYSIKDATSLNSFEIELNGTSLIKLMKTLYGAVDESYHFEILFSDNNNISLVQVYDNYSAASSPCKIGYKREK